ncbi:receptor activity-modifying protein 1-like [Rhynchocyon petersi]
METEHCSGMGTPLTITAGGHHPRASRYSGDTPAGTDVEKELTYDEVTECTREVASSLDCFWPGAAVDRFFVAIHQQYFENCSVSGRALRDPPGSVLCAFVVVPVLLTLGVTALVVWQSQPQEGIV